jgi:hypothetical protein
MLNVPLFIQGMNIFSFLIKTGRALADLQVWNGLIQEEFFDISWIR